MSGSMSSKNPIPTARHISCLRVAEGLDSPSGSLQTFQDPLMIVPEIYGRVRLLFFFGGKVHWGMLLQFCGAVAFKSRPLACHAMCRATIDLSLISFMSGANHPDIHLPGKRPVNVETRSARRFS